MNTLTFLNPRDKIIDDFKKAVFKTDIKAYIKRDRDHKTDKKV